MSNDQLNQWTVQAAKLGADAATSAASWVTDGNHSIEHYRRIAQLMDDGDPRLDEYLPTRPDLSGEWADSATPIGLYEEVTGLVYFDQREAAGMAYETLVGSVLDAIANAWEESAAEVFESECERLVRAQLA